MTDNNEQTPKFDALNEVIEYYVNQFYPGVLVNMLTVMEFATADEHGPTRMLRTTSSNDMPVWTAKGLLTDVLDQLRNDDLMANFFAPADEEGNDDE